MDAPIRILIAGDQPRARNSQRALLSTWRRAQVREAGSGHEAIDLVDRFRPSLVLMDVRMPEGDGLEATRAIRARWSQVKVVVLSMYADPRQEALAAGAHAFVGKEEAPERLLSVLSALVEPGLGSVEVCPHHTTLRRKG